MSIAIFVAMLFKDVIGQRETKKILIDLVEHNRLSHALLFVGREGSGALPLAIALAGYISLPPTSFGRGRDGLKEPILFDNVEMGGEKTALPQIFSESPDEWVEKHASYSKIRDMVHPDIHFSYPVVTKKPGTPSISTDYIREWREFMTQYPYGNITIGCSL